MRGCHMFAGRVPLRVVGPITAGDVLVPSGCNDGVAAVMDVRERDSLLEDCACVSIQDAAIKGSLQASAAVALTSCTTIGETMVECIVTPPAMTRDVVASLKGTPQVFSVRKMWARVIAAVAAIVLVLCVTPPLHRQSLELSLRTQPTPPPSELVPTATRLSASSTETAIGNRNWKPPQLGTTETTNSQPAAALGKHDHDAHNDVFCLTSIQLMGSGGVDIVTEVIASSAGDDRHVSP